MLFMKKSALLLSLCALGLLGVIPPTASLALRILPAVLAAGICVFALRRAIPAFHVALVVLGMTVFMAAGLLWQIALPLAIVAAAVVRRFAPQSGDSSQFGGMSVVRGRIPLGLTLFAGFVTPGALICWVYLLKPDLSDLTGMIPAQPLGLLILGGVVFAVVNATFEEWVWRGIFQPALHAEFGLTWAIVLQAVSFGVAHTHGFPRGAVGVLLAGTWALILGVLRQVAGGLLAPVLAHLVADATIAGIVIWLA